MAFLPSGNALSVAGGPLLTLNQLTQESLGVMMNKHKYVELSFLQVLKLMKEVIPI